MKDKITPEFLISILRELIEAEAEYRSAMKIYKHHPGHKTRIHAESRWYHAHTTAKSLLKFVEDTNEGSDHV